MERVIEIGNLTVLWDEDADEDGCIRIQDQFGDEILIDPDEIGLLLDALIEVMGDEDEQ